MPEPHAQAAQPEDTARALWQIDECPDLMVDGHVADRNGNLVFLSVWGRDTAIQQFLARLTLGGQEDGLDHFHLAQGAQTLPTFVDDDRLEKRLTRCYRQTLFGALANCWLFDRRCVKPDKANATALALLPRDSAHRVERLWTLVKDTCPLPLLDHWREPVLELLTARDMLEALPTALGPLEGHWLKIDVPQLAEALGQLIRAGILTAEARAEPLRLAA
ncbi:MAG: hypothetical protein LBD06_10870 [Candidatus Accumulibacter sp.]|jgi:hypothetical protein|nr:hypothetical protein [Accumulibacter sp.]